MLMKNYFIFLIIWILLVLESHAQLRWIGKVCFFFVKKLIFTRIDFREFYKHHIFTHRASGVRNFWHLSAKILHTVEPKSATSPCVHFEVAASPTEKKHHFSMNPF